MVKKKKSQKSSLLNQLKDRLKQQKKVRPGSFHLLGFLLGLLAGVLFLGLLGILVFEKKYQARVYPGIKILGVDFGGKKPQEIEYFLNQKNFPFENLKITFEHQDKVATLSGQQIDLGFDNKLSSTQAYLLGRSGNFWSRSLIKWQLVTRPTELKPLFKWEKEPLKQTLKSLAEEIDLPSQNARFEFQGSKVTAFRLSKRGRRVNTQKTLALLEKKLSLLVNQSSPSSQIKVSLKVEVVEPQVTIASANDLGIESLLGRGVSYFGGSSKERIHNIALSSSILHGILINPRETFSLNQALGDISPATGYQSSYIIKEGKTVLGDGGGVCQTSTTLFRAALNSGLKIVERHPHSYRVSYYEQGGFSPGIDATVFAPRVDLKIQNNTSAYALIQTHINYNNASLTFEFYGKDDDRKAQISKVKIWDQKPPSEDKYIDDPTLPKDEIKQIDWKAWGGKTSFSYKVVRNGEVLEDEEFFSNFLPWQAVFLRGTRE